MKMNVWVLALLLPFLFACSKESPELQPKKRITEDGVSEKPKGFEAFNPKVDILLVIDDSGSMADVQTQLVKNAQLFADSISKSSLLNFHIGILTSSCNSGMFCGRLQGTPNFVTKSTPDMAANLARKMRVGISGDGNERFFDPVKTALSAPLNTTFNKDFYRADAFLAVIFITDAAEQSVQKSEDFLKFLVGKKGKADKVLAYAVMRKQKEQEFCLKGIEDPLTTKLEDFLKAVSNGDELQTNVLSLCSRAYGARLADFAKDIVRRTTGSVPLSRVPDEKTIRVFYGRQEIPNDARTGWTYEPSKRAIALAEGIEWDLTQGPNTELRVDFEAVDMNAQE